MRQQSRDVCVVGGGIGGLAAAIALGRQGHTVTLLEKRPKLEGIGAGIILAPNATSALDALGVSLGEHAHPLTSLEVHDADGGVLSRLTPQSVVDHPAVALPRPALHEALVRALPTNVTVRVADTVQDFDERGDHVHVTTQAGAELEVDWLVGADGLRSRVREQAGRPARLRYSGTTCWRGLMKNPGIGPAVEAWGGAARLGAVPLAHGELYYFLVLTAPPETPAPPWPELRAAFGALGGPAGRVLAAIDEPPPLHHDLWELDAPRWGQGRVLLLGDAAHAMTPNQGQGAAMALEDALALALALREHPESPLARYRALRHARVRRVQLDSRRFGAVAHWQSALPRRVRDWAIRALPERAAARHYRALVEPGLALARALA